MFCCLLCTSLSLFIDHPTKYIRRQQVEAVLLKALNAARDVVINPEIHKEIPDPIKVDIDQKGSASAGCIIPSPFGCICHASASYDVHLDTLYVSHERCHQCIQYARRRLYPCGAILFIRISGWCTSKPKIPAQFIVYALSGVFFFFLFWHHLLTLLIC